jgi:uncharacterized membrane protein YphA (DoxX/SURF4 family)
MLTARLPSPSLNEQHRVAPKTSAEQSGKRDLAPFSEQETTMATSADTLESTTLKTVRWKAISFTILRIVLALFLMLAGVMKIIGAQQMIDLFDTVGIGQWFRIFTGVFELVTGLLLLYPATIGIGALLGVAAMVGATIANIFILHHDFIHSSVPAIIFAIIAWTRRGDLLRMVGSGDPNS